MVTVVTVATVSRGGGTYGSRTVFAASEELINSGYFKFQELIEGVCAEREEFDEKKDLELFLPSI